LYDANFTAGGLLLDELIALEGVMGAPDAHERLKREEEANDFMAVKTLGARKRILTELKRRNDLAPEGFWSWYYSLSKPEQALAAFYLCLKAYRLVLDMHMELGVKKYRIGSDLKAYDVALFLDGIAGADEDVATWSPMTLDKLNSQYRTVLKDAGLFEKNQLGKVYGIPQSFWDFFMQRGEGWFLEACFEA
jgi:hypothetical protein